MLENVRFELLQIVCPLNLIDCYECTGKVRLSVTGCASLGNLGCDCYSWSCSRTNYFFRSL